MIRPSPPPVPKAKLLAPTGFVFNILTPNPFLAGDR
jgi:hypothetical protein